MTRGEGPGWHRDPRGHSLASLKGKRDRPIHSPVRLRPTDRPKLVAMTERNATIYHIEGDRFLVKAKFQPQYEIRARDVYEAKAMVESEEQTRPRKIGGNH